jgi:ribonuclease HI
MRYETSTLVFMDGSISADGTGFGVYVPGVRQVGYRLHESSSVFTAEISALLNALLFIKSSQPSEYLILSDSLSSIGALRSKRISARTQFKVRLMWISAHVGVPGNEMLGGIAEDGAKKLYYPPGVRLLPVD